MKQLIEINDQTTEEVGRVLARFAGDNDRIVQVLSDIGIYFGRITTADPVETDDKPENTQAEQPKEWIERQEEERRAWAVNTAIEHIRTCVCDHSAHGDLVKLAGEIVEFVRGNESKDLNDVDAQDTFYGVLFEILKGGVPEEEFLEEYMIHIVDQLAKNGVRLKDGERSDMP